ncbi:MAG: hypothetical protein PVI99_04905 [Anaerolineales bacterium]|jgi:hypothetical protein
MNQPTKIGVYLLIPPLLLWALIILFMIDSTLAQYFFSKMNLQTLDMLFFIAGLVFPGAAFVAGVRGIRMKKNRASNIAIILISTLMLTLMGIYVFVL